LNLRTVGWKSIWWLVWVKSVKSCSKMGCISHFRRTLFLRKIDSHEKCWYPNFKKIFLLCQYCVFFGLIFLFIYDAMLVAFWFR
jgi:hypothetical protein